MAERDLKSPLRDPSKHIARAANDVKDAYAACQTRTGRAATLATSPALLLYYALNPKSQPPEGVWEGATAQPASEAAERPAGLLTAVVPRRPPSVSAVGLSRRGVQGTEILRWFLDGRDSVSTRCRDKLVPGQPCTLAPRTVGRDQSPPVAHRRPFKWKDISEPILIVCIPHRVSEEDGNAADLQKVGLRKYLRSPHGRGRGSRACPSRLTRRNPGTQVHLELSGRRRKVEKIVVLVSSELAQADPGERSLSPPADPSHTEPPAALVPAVVPPYALPPPGPVPTPSNRTLQPLPSPPRPPQPPPRTSVRSSPAAPAAPPSSSTP